MKTSRKLFSVLVALALAVAAVSSFFTFDASASAPAPASDGLTRRVLLNVEDGPIRIYTDRYYQNGVEYPGFSCETTQYVITGSALNADAVLRFVQDADDVPVATFHAIFRNLVVTPAEWCSVVHFKTYKPDPAEGEPAPMTVNLRLEGTNVIMGYNHPGLSGNAAVNLSAAPDSYSCFFPEYGDTTNGFDGALTLRKVGEYEVKVNHAVADLEAGKTGKPVTIIGADSAALVAAQIDALPSVSEVGLSDKDAVTSARAAYNALSNEKRESFDTAVLQRLVDDENAIAELEAARAAAETAAEKSESVAPKPKKNLTALWVILGFLGGAACAVVVTLLVLKKKNGLPPSDAEQENEPEPAPQSQNTRLS